jgi:predicted aconitase with swiveling domain
MAKEFKGRVVLAEDWSGEAIVSTVGVNTLATFQKSAMKNNPKEALCGDQNNPELYGRNLTGKALCLPQTIGSTTGGMVLQTACDMGIAPAAMLFSEHIDSLAAAGIILAAVWGKNQIIAIDCLGEEFLAYVKSGMRVQIDKDGTVRVEG